MKIADIKPDTIYLVDRDPSSHQRDYGYAQTRKNIVAQVRNEQVYRKSASGLTWGYDPVKKDRLSIRPVVFIDNEWVFDEEGSRYTKIAPSKGEWGQIQTRYILSEADMGKITAEQQAEKDLDRLSGYSCRGTSSDRRFAIQVQDGLAREAFEFYADHLSKTATFVDRPDDRDVQEMHNDARILREFDSYRSLR